VSYFKYSSFSVLTSVSDINFTQHICTTHLFSSRLFKYILKDHLFLQSTYSTRLFSSVNNPPKTTLHHQDTTLHHPSDSHNTNISTSATVTLHKNFSTFKTESRLQDYKTSTRLQDNYKILHH